MNVMSLLSSLNQSLVDSLKFADKVVVCGEAISHCVNYTVRDLVAAWPKERRRDLVILTDCASPVPGFEKAGEVAIDDFFPFALRVSRTDSVFLPPSQDFLRDMATAGLTLTTSDKFGA
jgi:nicotinamidase-related amidase